jgi:hypothetical protein
MGVPWLPGSGYRRPQQEATWLHQNWSEGGIHINRNNHAPVPVHHRRIPILEEPIRFRFEGAALSLEMRRRSTRHLPPGRWLVVSAADYVPGHAPKKERTQ